MATTRSFDTMLNEYLPNELLKEELIKRDWFIQNVNKDNNWLGGDSIVPFRGARASSIEFNQLAGSTDISSNSFIRGKMSGYKEVWGSLIFQHTDLMQHEKLSEQNLLKMLPDMIEDHVDYFKMVASINLLCGPHFAKVTDSTNAATGIMIVDRIDRFEIGQKCQIMDDNTTEVSVYITAVNVNTSAVTLSATRGGSAYNASSYTAAQNAKFYHPGIIISNVATGGFTSLRSGLLSAANGGSSTLHGQTKTAYPYLQAINYSGSSFTASNILDGIFDAFVAYQIKAKYPRAKDFVMSFKHWGSIMKIIEVNKGPFNVIPGSQKSTLYGWSEVELMGPRGSFKIVGIQEMDDDVIMLLDVKGSMTLRTNGFIKRRTAPDGKQFYETRATSGYSYIVDNALFGDLELTMPTGNMIIYGISY